MMGTAPVTQTPATASGPSAGAWSDEALVRGLRARDAAAAAAFFDAYQGYVNGLVGRLLGRDDEHVDVVNAAFAEIFSSIHALREPRALASWVGAVTVHTVRNEIRRRKMYRLFHVFSLGEIPVEGISRTDEEVVARIYKVLHGMKTEDHLVFALRYIAGYTYDEVADHLGISIATAKRRGKRCVAAFKRRVAADPVLADFVEGLRDV